jgi:nicotinate-nucleotide adenylyltransferase
VSSRELALFGTSADPPTEGHQALLLGLAQRYGEVAAWASDNPFKQHGAPLELRAQLLGTLIESLGNDQVQLAQDLSSPKAIETLDRAAIRWPDRQLVFVVGGDLAGQIPSWYRAADLLRRCRLTVVPRQGHPMAEGALERLRDLGAQVELLELPVPATASSAIRGGQENSSIPEVLWPELLKHNLYGLTSKLAP